jgi:hypothetical protein
MRLEVYLLSIPLMRHRNIVPRTRRSTALLKGTEVQGPDQPQNRLPETVGESRTYHGMLQRLDPS